MGHRTGGQGLLLSNRAKMVLRVLRSARCILGDKGLCLAFLRTVGAGGAPDTWMVMVLSAGLFRMEETPDPKPQG